MTSRLWQANGARWRAFVANYQQFRIDFDRFDVPANHALLHDVNHVIELDLRGELGDDQVGELPAEFFVVEHGTEPREPVGLNATADSETPVRPGSSSSSHLSPQFIEGLTAIARGDRGATITFLAQQRIRIETGAATAAEVIALDESGVHADAISPISLWISCGADAWEHARTRSAGLTRPPEVVQRDGHRAFMLEHWVEQIASEVGRTPSRLPIGLLPPTLLHRLGVHDPLTPLRAVLESTGAHRTRPTRALIDAAHARGECAPYWELVAATGRKGIAGILEALDFPLTDREQVVAEKLVAIRDWFETHEPLKAFRVIERQHVMDAHDAGITWSFTHWVSNVLDNGSLDAINAELGFDTSFAATMARREAGLHAWMAERYPDMPDRPFEIPDVHAASKDGYTWSYDTWLKHTNTTTIRALQVALHRDALAWAARGVHRYMLETYGDDQRPPTRLDIDAACLRDWTWASDTWARAYGSLPAAQRAMGFDPLEWTLNGLRLHQLLTTGDADTPVTQGSIRSASKLKRSYGDEWLFNELKTTRVADIRAAVTARMSTPVRIPAWARAEVDRITPRATRTQAR